MKKFFLEEKKGSMLPRVAPELSMDTWWYYKACLLYTSLAAKAGRGVPCREPAQAADRRIRFPRYKQAVKF